MYVKVFCNNILTIKTSSSFVRESISEGLVLKLLSVILNKDHWLPTHHRLLLKLRIVSELWLWRYASGGVVRYRRRCIHLLLLHCRVLIEVLGLIVISHDFFDSVVVVVIAVMINMMFLADLYNFNVVHNFTAQIQIVFSKLAASDDANNDYGDNDAHYWGDNCSNDDTC